MKKQFLSVRSALLTVPVLAVLFFGYQNCGEGFAPTPGEFLNNPSISANRVPLNVLKAPVERTAYLGGNVTFSAVASSEGTVTYQWWKGNLPLAGEIGPTMTLTDLTADDSGSYWVRITATQSDSELEPNVYSFPPKNLVVADVPAANFAPLILGQSPSANVDDGAIHVLSTVVSGYPVPSVQWYLDEQPLPGEVNDFLVIQEMSAANAGTYHAEYSNSEGVTISDPILLAPANTMVGPTIVDVAPSSHNISAGQALNLFVKAVGLPSLSYRWAKNGMTLEGVTGPTYSIPQGVSTGGDSGQYSVTVTVDPLPGQAPISTVEVFDVIVIDALQFVTTPENLMVGVGREAIFTAVVSGQVETYQWFKDDVPIQGANQAGYQIVSVSPEDAGVYKIQATNEIGTIEAMALLTVVQPPVIVTQPQAAAVDYKAAASFSVAATGLNLSYQWFLDGTAINGAINNTYNIPVAEENHIGAYTVSVTNQAATVTSNPAQLVVNLPAGVPLYTTNCASCHGAPVSLSNKRNRTAQNITNAIANVGAMSNLDFLTPAQIQAIADVLAD